MNELEDMFIKEDKKPEVKKPEEINIMDEDNDNDQKDKRPLRKKSNIEATRHNISDIQKLKLF